MRFYCDEHISNAVARGLLLRGHNVEIVVETGNSGKDDRFQLAYALHEQRILITADVDFLVLAQATRQRHNSHKPVK